jgi:hypothetical protein
MKLTIHLFIIMFAVYIALFTGATEFPVRMLSSQAGMIKIAILWSSKDKEN